ncbi:hypothetical protein J2T57_001229 [Natronocella acetinitrilica]|uniref:PD-(D/E)XK endonuclease-like domain-containing protein n=1 Tax=Natronocella acetinitrilica TaxID=414046 RepID=A0AAE3G5B2_9GAMM|nr:PD-(D/E)XK nuclease family protein [Natronocella acetinitrilica]MCP1674127.1 hypothetical protein [Natronocella acetinitrilica]
MVLSNDLHFVLLPDPPSARRGRRYLAERGGGVGLVAGSWMELLELARRAYGVDLPPESAWRERLLQALLADDAAFWAQSVHAAPEEVARVVEQALRWMLAAHSPDTVWPQPAPEGLASRVTRHFNELSQLLADLGEFLPVDYRSIRGVLASTLPPSRRIRVYAMDAYPEIDGWQRALIARLNADAGESMSPSALAVMMLSEFAGAPALAEEGSALAHVQRSLYHPGAQAAPSDGSVRCVGVRDSREEAEVAAGMAQRLLSVNPLLKRSEIGLLLPPLGEYVEVVREVFSDAGLPLSGLPRATDARDLGREALSLFLSCRDAPAPRMALAALYASPLMPWGAARGRDLAQSVMAGRLRYPELAELDVKSAEVVRMLSSAERTNGGLAGMLERFVALLAPGDYQAVHIERARETANMLISALGDADEFAAPDFPALQALTRPGVVALEADYDYNLEGITVSLEGYEPWRGVRHLFVLGFSQTHYPVEVPQSPVFHPEELAALERVGGLDMPTPRVFVEQHRRRFLRHLRLCRDTLTCLMPRLSRTGETLSPSASLDFLKDLIDPAGEPLVLDIDAAEDRARLAMLPLAGAAEVRAPVLARESFVSLGVDLLDPSLPGRRGPKNETPTSAETLIVSPLAWTLRRLGALPILWEAEGLAGRERGTLAHAVFDRLFRPGLALPTASEIPDLVRLYLTAAIGAEAPFIASDHWEVERRHMVTELTRAALAWRRMLESLGATVVGAEARLRGEFDGVPMLGDADCLLALPGAGVFVVDYKRSRQRSWEDRMTRGYDIQTPLYRRLLGQMAEADRPEGLRGIDPGAVGVAYYTLEDERLISDRPAPPGSNLAEWTGVEEDVSAAAIQALLERFDALRSGTLAMNVEGDAEAIERATGIKPYALGASPLIELFSQPAQTEDA